MAKRVTYFLAEVMNNHLVTRQTDFEFLNLLERGMLMALKEAGYLNEIQFRMAYENQKKQYRKDKGKQVQNI